MSRLPWTLLPSKLCGQCHPETEPSVQRDLRAQCVQYLDLASNDLDAAIAGYLRLAHATTTPSELKPDFVLLVATLLANGGRIGEAEEYRLWLDDCGSG